MVNHHKLRRDCVSLNVQQRLKLCNVLWFYQLRLKTFDTSEPKFGSHYVAICCMTDSKRQKTHCGADDDEVLHHPAALRSGASDPAGI